MAEEFNPDPWNRTEKYVDRMYPSAVARERPMLTTRVHCIPEEESTMREAALQGPMRDRGINRIEEMRAFREADQAEHQGESRVDWFNRQLRHGHGDR